MANNMNRRPSGNFGNMHNNMHTMPNTPRNSNNNGSNGNNDASCEELLHAIMEADFFAQDLKLYLDTHPDDTRAVEMFREAVKQTAACRAAFEDSFYPLTSASAGMNGTWDWPEGVWPPFN